MELVCLNVLNLYPPVMKMDSGSVIILAHQHNTYIGMAHVLTHVIVLFFQKLKETLSKNIVIILAQLINLFIGITAANQPAVSL
jgi:uncharacterized membrane protein